MVEAAPELLAAGVVGCRDVLCQLQRQTELVGVELQPGFRLGQGLLGSGNLSLQPLALCPESIGGGIVAFQMQSQQTLLLGLELADQCRLGVPHLLNRLLADCHQRLDGGGAGLDVLPAELDGPFPVVASNGGLDQVRPDVGAHGAGRPVAGRPAHAEEVGVVAVVAASGNGEAQPLAAGATEDRAFQVVLAELRAFASSMLLSQASLDAVEGVLVDQRLVAAGKNPLLRRTPLVDDQAGVVGVVQDAVQD